MMAHRAGFGKKALENVSSTDKTVANLSASKSELKQAEPAPRGPEGLRL